MKIALLIVGQARTYKLTYNNIHDYQSVQYNFLKNED